MSTYETNQQRSEAANQAFWSFMEAYAEAIGERPTKDDPETRAARKIAAEAFDYLLPYPVTDDDRATVAAMVEAIADRWTQDHQPRDLFSEQAEYEQYAAEFAAHEPADTLKTYTAEEARELDAAAQLMDDDIREELHASMAPCSPAEFLAAYEAAHLAKYGAPFQYV